MIPEINDKVIEKALAIGVDELSPEANNVTRKSVDRAKEAGFTVRCWGVKSPEMIINAYISGAYGSTTSWPDESKVIIKKYLSLSQHLDRSISEATKRIVES